MRELMRMLLALVVVQVGCTMSASTELSGWGPLRPNRVDLPSGAMSGDERLLCYAPGSMTSQASLSLWTDEQLCFDINVRTIRAASSSFMVTVDVDGSTQKQRWRAAPCLFLECFSGPTDLEALPADGVLNFRVRGGQVCIPAPMARADARHVRLELRQGAAKFRFNWHVTR